LIDRGTEPSAAWCRTTSTLGHRLAAPRTSRRSPVDHPEAQAGVGVDRQDVVEVAPVAVGEVVEADHGLAEVEQTLEERRADEPGDPGHQPAARRC
jgi:hypothetical protein